MRQYSSQSSLLNVTGLGLSMYSCTYFISEKKKITNCVILVPMLAQHLPAVLLKTVHLVLYEENWVDCNCLFYRC